MPSALTLHSSPESHRTNRRQVLAWALLVALIIFVLDPFLPLGIAEAVPYVAVVLIALRSPEKNDPVRLAGLCTILTIAGYAITPSDSGAEPWIAITNRIIALFAIWSAALLAIQVKEADAATREHSSMLTGILSNMPAIAFRIGKDGIMREAIGRGLNRFGFKEFTTVGRIPLEPPSHIRSQIDEGKIADAVFYETNGILDGTPWWFLNCLCKLEGKRDAVIGFGIDITDRKRAECRLATHNAVSSILSRSSHTVKDLPLILKALCETLAWRVGILWKMDFQRQALRADTVWPHESLQAQAMTRLPQGQAIAPDVGLAGHVWDASKPMWINDIVEWDKDPRSRIALEQRLHSGLAIPIRLNGTTQAVLELFSSHPQEPDDELLQMFTNIGFQIGQSIERDIQDRRLATHHSITNVLAESPGLSHAASLILEIICDNLEWDIGAIWQIDASQDVLRCITIWHSPLLSLEAFQNVSKNMTFSRGIGLPGSVWKNREPVWISDVASESNFPRSVIAAQENLHAGFGFPIKSGAEILGVMEFFHRDIQKPDNELLQMFSSIGLQIGQFIQRTKGTNQEGMKNLT